MRPLLPSEGRAGIEGEPAIVAAGEDTTPLRNHDKEHGPGGFPARGGYAELRWLALHTSVLRREPHVVLESELSHRACPNSGVAGGAFGASPRDLVGHPRQPRWREPDRARAERRIAGAPRSRCAHF